MPYCNPLAEVYEDDNVKKGQWDDGRLWNPKDCLTVVNNYLNSNAPRELIGTAMTSFVPVIPVGQIDCFLQLLSLLDDLKGMLNKMTKLRYASGKEGLAELGESSLAELQEIASLLSVSFNYAMYYAFSSNSIHCHLVAGLATNCCRLYRRFQQPKTHGMDPLDQEMITKISASRCDTR